MKKFSLAWAALLCAVLILASCTTTVTPTPTAAPTAAPTAEPTDEPVVETNLALGGTADAFRSNDNCGPEKAVDGDLLTCWSSSSAAVWMLDLGKPTEFNTVVVNFACPNTTRWSVQYYNETEQKYMDIPGCVANYQDITEGVQNYEFHINAMTAQKFQFNLYDGGPNVSIFEFELYNRAGQDPEDSRNSFITVRRNRVLSEVNVGTKTDLFSMIPASLYAGTDHANWTTEVETDASKLTFDNSKWCKGLDEISVFDTQITHTQKNDSSLNWTMRVGLGGQVYSLETAVGEIIPPQNKGAEWMDEVWQIVSVSNARMYDRSYIYSCHFIHQAGMYKDADHNATYGRKNMTDDSFFSPRLAQKWDADTSTLSVLNLGVTPSINFTRSDLLYYTDIADKGDGIIEFTYALSNYADYKLDFFNFPWGGVRYSIFKDFFVAKDGGLQKVEPSCQDVFTYNSMDGWFAYTQDMNNPDSFTVAFVCGNDSYDDGTASKKNGGPSMKVQAYYTGDPVRDYYVLQTISGRTVLPDETYYYRYYVVMGKLSDVKTKVAGLVDKVMMGFIRNDAATVSLTPIYKSTDDGKAILTTAENGAPVFYTYSQTIEGAKPLYLLYDTTAERYIVSVDPYILSTELPVKDYDVDMTEKAYKKIADDMIKDVSDGKTEYMGILGFVMLSDNMDSTDGYVKLSDLLGKDIFPGTGLEDDQVYVKTSK